MSSDRDSRRRLDPLHRPDSGKGRIERARTQSGEADSDDSWRDDSTPTARPMPPVVVDSSAFEADIRWREFDEMRDEVRRCKDERLASIKRKKWITGILTGAVGSIMAALLYAVQAINARGAASEVDRQLREMTRRHEAEIRQLQTDGAAYRALVDILLRRPARNPDPRDEP